MLLTMENGSLLNMDRVIQVAVEDLTASEQTNWGDFGVVVYAESPIGRVIVAGGAQADCAAAVETLAVMWSSGRPRAYAGQISPFTPPPPPAPPLSEPPAAKERSGKKG